MHFITFLAESDVPVPGIPVPGNLSFYLMVSEKFGTEKSLGTGLEKNLVPKKVSEPVPKKFGTEKSPGIGLGKKLVPKKVSEPITEIFGIGLETFRSRDFPT